MELKLKAYKCIFPDFFIDAYNENKWLDDKQFEIIFGKNQKEAVRDKCKNDESYSYFELKKHIRTRRFKEYDLYSQTKSILLNDLTDKQINHLLHSLGVREGDFCPTEFYRNYSVYNEKHEDCEMLCSIGLMYNRQQFNNEVYHVTDKGIEAIKTLLLIHK